jgi:hypothetical protein
MKVSLRKANALQLAIKDAIKALSFEAAATINEYQVAAKVINDAKVAFLANVGRRCALQNALYEIRKAVSAANSESGISAICADVARLEQDLVFYNTHAKAKVREEDGVVIGKLDRIRNRKEDGFYGSTDVTTGVLTQVEVQMFVDLVAKTKKEKQALQDNLLELNVRTEIELSAETVDALTAEKIL